MKKSKLYISLLAAAVIGLTSCKNDLDVIAPGEESVSVYGILNPNASTQYIRINKVYLTDGDAIAAGQDANTINYGPGELTVTLQRFMTGSTTPTLTSKNSFTRTEIVLTDTVIMTNSGIFNQSQRLWKTTDKLYSTGEYKLTIRHGEKEFTAQNLVMDSIKTISSQPTMPFIYNPNNPSQFPMHGGYPANPVSTDKPKYVNYDNPTLTYTIPFFTVANARLYDVVVRFHYIDSLVAGGTPIAQYVDFTIPTMKSSDLAGGEKLTASFTGDEFYSNLSEKISAKTPANLKNRKADYLEYIITAGSESLSEFLQVNAPSNTIAQDKPYFTNIKGGVGIFSSKSRSTVTKDMWADMIDKLSCYPTTFSLKFCDYAGHTRAVACP